MVASGKEKRPRPIYRQTRSLSRSLLRDSETRFHKFDVVVINSLRRRKSNSYGDVHNLHTTVY